MRRPILASLVSFFLLACSGDGSGGSAGTDGEAGGTGEAGEGASSGGEAGEAGSSAGTTGGGSGSATTSATATGGTGSASTTTTSGETSSGGTSEAGETGPTGDLEPPPNVLAIGSNGVNGLDWDAVEGATGYVVHWSLTPGVTPGSADSFPADAPGVEHRSLTNGTPYYYVVTAVNAGGASAPSAEATATPGGEWVLEQFGNGTFDDVLTGAPTAKVPVADRLHLLLFAEGYTAGDLPTFHSDADHGGARDGDVDGWIDLVFGIEPYALFPEAFVVWYLPRPSNTTIRDPSPDTAFQVPVDVSSSFPGTGSIPSDGETAARAWAAIDMFAYPPTDFSGGGFGSVRKLTASFLIYDPDRGRASVSGRALSLRNPADDSQRISSAFGVGHAHEFSHAFASLRDEYLENDNSPPDFSPTTNVTDSNACGELPWQHLIMGGSFNPSTDELVGAFGVPAIGFHSELLCLMNGTHDNAQYYGGDGLLRVEDRMCNFCRETATYRIFQRSGILDEHDPWVASYRTVFYERFGFQVPTVVPQTNDAENPGSGDPIFEACDGALVVHRDGPRVAARGREGGCLGYEP